MQEKSVVFYCAKSDFFSTACRLIEKMYAMNERVLVLCSNDEEVDFYNSKLWTFSRLSFIPSGNRKSLPIEDAEFCHTWFSTDIDFYNKPINLLHNGLTISNIEKLKLFNCILDVFAANEIDQAKSRSRNYKDIGFDQQKFWVQTDSSWIIGQNLS
ncbi:MAG: DNA polymerase III subunit chi [Holosporales bacterium]|jgi:DNA polymerase IIIc chi subunit|nr:DNA polymerase III subunit chi [Holosporales bacterium]